MCKIVHTLSQKSTKMVPERSNCFFFLFMVPCPKLYLNCAKIVQKWCQSCLNWYQNGAQMFTEHSFTDTVFFCFICCFNNVGFFKYFDRPLSSYKNNRFARWARWARSRAALVHNVSKIEPKLYQHYTKIAQEWIPNLFKLVPKVLNCFEIIFKWYQKGPKSSQNCSKILPCATLYTHCPKVVPKWCRNDSTIVSKWSHVQSCTKIVPKLY